MFNGFLFVFDFCFWLMFKIMFRCVNIVFIDYMICDYMGIYITFQLIMLALI